MKCQRLLCLLVPVLFLAMPTSYGQMVDGDVVGSGAGSSSLAISAWSQLPQAERDSILQTAQRVYAPLDQALPGYPGFPAGEKVDLAAQLPSTFNLAHQHSTNDSLTRSEAVLVAQA